MSDLIQVGQENSSSIEHYHEDYGSAPPVMLIQGLPLNLGKAECRPLSRRPPGDHL